MKALDSLKADIDNYNKLVMSDIEWLYLKIQHLYKNYSKMDLNEICVIIEAMYDEINEIAKENAVLRKMESYYKVFEEEQENTNDDYDLLEEFEKWETEHTPNEKYKRQEVTLNELLRSKSFNCTDK